ncbi:MAG: hypothetical protein F6K50_50265 [Moorea sp. SIO3I7]|nr:hypothetical protein [Moorena sp. SIO3I7]
MSLLKQISADTATAIELAPEQPLNYHQAILEIKSLAEKNPEFGQVLQELAEAAQEDPNIKLTKMIKEIINTLNSDNSEEFKVKNLGKLAEKIGLVVQGGKVEIKEFKF